jgi:hypothetical protein
MTPQEARALLNLDDEQDLKEQLEFALFEYKQKIYRQLDQVLLYPKWFSKLEQLQKAAVALDVSFPDKHLSIEDLNITLKTNESLLSNFNAYQHLKARAARLIYQGSSPMEVSAILSAFLIVQQQWFAFWVQANTTFLEVQLSQQFDPQSIHSLLKLLESQGIKAIKELQDENTPALLKTWISWQKAILQKMKSD